MKTTIAKEKKKQLSLSNKEITLSLNYPVFIDIICKMSFVSEYLEREKNPNRKFDIKISLS